MKLRLKAEANRQNLTEEECRDLMIQEGLDAAKEKRQKMADAEALTADIIIVTATDTEFKQMKKKARELGLPFKPKGGKRFITYYQLGKPKDDTIALIKVNMGPFGREGSVAKCLLACIETTARSVILVGTAFGLDRKQHRIGDVLVSDSIFLYDNRTVGPRDTQENSESGINYSIWYDHEIELRASEVLLNMFSEYERKSEYKRVFTGLLLSGGALVECQEFIDHITETKPELKNRLLGGEMEAAGLISADAWRQSDDPSWIVVKGIVDFADTASRKTVNENRDFAAERAADFVLRALIS